MLILYPGYEKHWKEFSKKILGTALRKQYCKDFFFNVSRRRSLKWVIHSSIEEDISNYACLEYYLIGFISRDEKVYSHWKELTSHFQKSLWRKMQALSMALLRKGL